MLVLIVMHAMSAHSGHVRAAGLGAIADHALYDPEVPEVPPPDRAWLAHSVWHRLVFARRHQFDLRVAVEIYEDYGTDRAGRNQLPARTALPMRCPQILSHGAHIHFGLDELTFSACLGHRFDKHRHGVDAVVVPVHSVHAVHGVLLLRPVRHLHSVAMHPGWLHGSHHSHAGVGRHAVHAAHKPGRCLTWMTGGLVCLGVLSSGGAFAGWFMLRFPVVRALPHVLHVVVGDRWSFPFLPV